MRSLGLKMGGRLLDTLLPPLCLTCRQEVAAWGALCPTCFSGLEFIEEPFCEKLCLPFEYEVEGETLSQQAIDFPPNYTAARAVLRFTPTAKRLVHGVKYHDRLELIAMLSGWMMRAGGEIITKCEMIVPVPLHWTRLFTRKFNQAGEFARFIAKERRKTYAPHLLKRIKRTPTQTGFSRAQRQQNMQAAFALAPKTDIKGKVILLVDDVLTTGATLEACTQVLLEGGAKAVYVLTLARVIIEQREED